MKKLLPLFCLVLALAGCGDSSGPVSVDRMNKGYIHFATIMAMQDIVARGEASPFFYLSPAPLLNTGSRLDAKDVIMDFRRDFSSAEDRYYRLRGRGAVVHGVVTDTDAERQEIVFTFDEPEAKPPFEGMLRLSLDRAVYSASKMPAVKKGDTAAFMCSEYRPVHDLRNPQQHRVEVRMIECRTADDYYRFFQEKVTDRLMDVYAGRESVNEDLAKRLAMLYQAGQSLPGDSVCLYGDYLACTDNLASELSRKYGDVKAKDIGNMEIDPEKVTVRRFEQAGSEPAVRPDGANLSPSGQTVYDQPEGVKTQKEAVSKVKVPGVKK